jgi:hypothetical protein
MKIGRRMGLGVWVMLLAVTGSLLIAGRALAGGVAIDGGQVGEPVIPTDLLSLLMWLTTAGGASAVVSFIAEQIPAFQLPPEAGGLSSKAKWWIMLAASAALSIASKLLVDNLPAETISALSPYATVLIGVFVAFLANQAAHGIQKAAQKDRMRDLGG